MFLFQGTRISLCFCLLYPIGPLPLTTVRSVINPEDLPWGRWPLDSRSQVVLLKSVVSFSFLLQASKDRTVLFFLPSSPFLPPPRLHLIRIQTSLGDQITGLALLLLFNSVASFSITSTDITPVGSANFKH